jgi:uncharacterized protein YecT (DUF1311 family)
MMKKCFLLINVLLIFNGQNIAAADKITVENHDQPGIFSSETTNCADTTDLAVMNDCATKAYQQADKRLQELYQQLVPIKQSSTERPLLNSNEKKLFQQSHTSWLKSREDYCNFATQAVKNEPGYPFHKYDCLRRITQQYIQNLEKYIEDLDV